MLLLCIQLQYNVMGWFLCTSAANKCLLKVAQYAAQVEHYEKAVDIYEQVNKLMYTFSTNHISRPGRIQSAKFICLNELRDL